ncbi:hypothetical protein EUGRSUZ_F01017 [Eucalyptus grandis]|uniref:Uncharacterized protein n=2 Tax=Eucalyptus grandis TaxID=71139 RepID=A0ACC3KDB2_EUCGR|nr:hypothetical protein EUGRSUZ_F01017 [Eucalyptus grandis]
MKSIKRKREELTSRGVENMNESKWRKLKGCCSLGQAVKEFKEILPILERFLQETTTLAKGCSRRSPLVTTELVGGGTHRKINEIYSYLVQENISIIGVVGMVGVGKTAILTHVHNKLLENRAFDDVLWVNVPLEFSTYALQEEIANAVGLHNISNEKDVKRRASILYGHLRMKKSVLILDGLWMHFEVKDVGIPVEMGSVKLVLSTRSLDVCFMMLCQKQIKIKPLEREESWRLFLKVLCFAGKLPSDIEEIAKFIMHKCDGLPLGIIDIGTRMRGVEKVHEWKGMLQKFKDSRIELEAFKGLKLSYMNLALCFGEDLLETSREHLIESFIDEGLLDGLATLQELHDQGNTILDKMRKACLLDDLEVECLYLHPLTRYMALHMVTSTTHMVKAYMGLKEIPEEVFWTDCLERVYLQGNKIEEITHGISPNCPKLTRLLLNNNVMLGNIHTSFFRNLKVLKNLDLSNTQIAELPESVCHLDKLEVLLLRRCRALKLIPHVGKLGHLRKLDLQGCSSLDEVPEGMEMLVNLRYLDLDGTKIETLTQGVLGNLVNLQYLMIKKVRAGEVAKLKKLEALDCSVPDVETFNACMRFLEQNSSQQYKLVMDAPYHCESQTYRRIFINSCDHIIASIDGTSSDHCALIPESVQSLGVSRCHKLKSVMGWEWMITCFSKLEEIIVYNCDELEEIISGSLPSGATCFLTYLEVNGCNNMKRLLTQDISLHLLFLLEISIEDCKGIEVIIGTANMTHSFPKLIHLGPWNLPELKSICDGTMGCNSLRWISIYNCPKLRRIPLQLSLLDNGLPSPPPSLWEIQIDQQTWESLEWDNPLARDSLEHLVECSWFD